jgi:hypothetical protein
MMASNCRRFFHMIVDFHIWITDFYLSGLNQCLVKTSNIVPVLKTLTKLSKRNSSDLLALILFRHNHSRDHFPPCWKANISRNWKINSQIVSAKLWTTSKFYSTEWLFVICNSRHWTFSQFLKVTFVGVQHDEKQSRDHEMLKVAHFCPLVGCETYVIIPWFHI